MIDLPVSSLPSTGVSAAPALGAAVTTLVIGAAEIPVKEQVLLRSLVRLLDGRAGLPLQFSDDLAQCHVVFVPDGWTRRLPSLCVGVQLRAEGAAPADGPSTGLVVSPPLRATNVMAVLDAAAALVADRAAAVTRGPASLFLALTRLAAARERRATVLPVVDGPWLCADFATGLLHGRLSLDELLTGACDIGEPRRPTAAEAEALKAQPGLRLRDVIWSAAHRLGEAGVPAAELRGAYRLQRWPDAVALSRPGYPRLAALLTSRPMNCAEACAASGLSLDTVRWFLAAGVALGIAAPAEATDAPRLREPAPNPAQRSLLGRLRERLKLW